MSRIVIDVPEESLSALKLRDDQVAGELRLAAMKLYELGRLSSGAAAGLAGLSRVQFLSRLSEYGIDTFRQSAEELSEEFRNA